MTKLTELTTFQQLQAHHRQIAEQSMQAWFNQDLERFEKFSTQAGGILLDYSKNRITSDTMSLLCRLAEEAGLAEHIAALFSGEPVNFTEQRPALHTALRSQSSAFPAVEATLKQMEAFVEQVQEQQWLGATGKPITHIVNIGIGGSHLGPMLTTQALKSFAIVKLQCHFISNIDELHLQEVLAQIPAESTLFIISSKSFTTLETLTNAKKIRAWLEKKLNTSTEKHFVAVTAVPEKAIQFGIPASQIFSLWDWVGGRYSIWSAIGLPLALLIGMKHFREFLAGAHAMDTHFREAPFAKNMPVIMALLGIWYINFFHVAHLAIIPYAHQLSLLPDYLRQLDMESNGKSINKESITLDYLTGPVIFGNHGGDGQHSYFQLLHQSPHFTPVDFILTAEQDSLFASALTQAQALMQGKSYQQALTETNNTHLATHKTIPGNRPSNILFLEAITPYHLGALLSLYEHKIYVQGVLWGINSFDQWGVELGKQLLPGILQDLQQNTNTLQHDASTNGLIKHYKRLKESS